MDSPGRDLPDREFEEDINEEQLTIFDLRAELEVAKIRCEAVLRALKEQMEKKEHAKELEVNLARKEGKLSVLDTLHAGKPFDYHAHRTLLQLKTENLKSELNSVNIPNIDWAKHGFPFMY